MDAVPSPSMGCSPAASLHCLRHSASLHSRIRAPAGTFDPDPPESTFCRWLPQEELTSQPNLSHLPAESDSRVSLQAGAIERVFVGTRREMDRHFPALPERHSRGMAGVLFALLK
jgi:hypothetical protein